VNRYAAFFMPRVPTRFVEDFGKAIALVRRKEVMPSMRALWAAGPALERENMAGFNCAYTVIDRPSAFGELLYVLMNGTGIGFSVERKYIKKLPSIPKEIILTDHTLIVNDSKEGWAQAINWHIGELFEGRLWEFDLSKIRARGERLATFGGRASGPEPLKTLLSAITMTFMNAAGRRLKSIECYDLCCLIASCVQVGGVRRSATISLSGLEDKEMRDAKTGDFPLFRYFSNNSAVYNAKPSYRAFKKEWKALVASKSGERGIANRAAMWLTAPSRREISNDFGLNPCGEIILLPNQVCNLSEAIIRPDDDYTSLVKKVQAATLLGMLQSSLTHFQFLNKSWKENMQKENLLGVSLTGLMDHPVLNHVCPEAQNMLQGLKDVAYETASVLACAMRVPMPAAITCVKPSGTVSQLVGCSSGLHMSHSHYYIRRVRVDSTDPLAAFMRAKGVPHQPEVGSTDTPTTWVFEFPIASPHTTITRNQRGAIKQLEYWKQLKQAWCEHNPSCSIYVKDDEWNEVRDWVWINWGIVSGLSFFPYDDSIYPLLPYEEVSEATYNTLVAAFPKDLVFTDLAAYEQGDNTTGAREYACSGGACEF
jgi:ribonucleoside-triphosphate reductase (thioredoxin)